MSALSGSSFLLLFLSSSTLGTFLLKDSKQTKVRACVSQPTRQEWYPQFTRLQRLTSSSSSAWVVLFARNVILDEGDDSLVYSELEEPPRLCGSTGPLLLLRYNASEYSLVLIPDGGSRFIRSSAA
jgi:hypothetical protein